MEIEIYYYVSRVDHSFPAWALHAFFEGATKWHTGLLLCRPGKYSRGRYGGPIVCLFRTVPSKKQSQGSTLFGPQFNLIWCVRFASSEVRSIPDILPSHLAGYQRLQVSGVIKTRFSSCGPRKSLSRLEPDDLEEIVEKLFEDGLEELYIKAGARNFLLINVPPKDRSPSGRFSPVLVGMYLAYPHRPCIARHVVEKVSTLE